MTRRELVAVLILLAIALLLAHLWPSPAASDQPVAASRIPASEFVAIRSAAPSALGYTAALPQPRTPSPTPRPAPAASAPSLRAVPRLAARDSAGTPQRGQDSRPIGSVTGSHAGRSPTASAPPSTVDWTARPGTITGVASTYGPGFDGYLALPAGPGVHVRVCGAGGCINRTSNDAGPDLAMQRRGRIVDLSVRDFELVCGVPWTRGLCRVSVETVQ